jgi:uncharacterized membrane protein YgaE (UPF0421/DUF939 family)
VEQLKALLRRPQVQRGLRAALAAGLAWQVAVLLPAPLSDYAYYAPLGAIVAVHPTVADSASAAWRTVLAILLGSGLAVAVHAATRPVPTALTLGLLVALSVGLAQWRVLGENRSWVTFAAVFTLTVGSGNPVDYVLSYAGLVLLGAAVGVLVTSVLFPPLQLTQAVRQIAGTRTLLAEHLERVAANLRFGRPPSPEEEQHSLAELDRSLDRLRTAEQMVVRARRANPRARRWQGAAERVRDESRALDRVAVLVDDVTTLVIEQQPHRPGGDGPELGTAERLADALDGLAGLVRTPYHDPDRGDRPDDRDQRITNARDALDNLTDRLRRSTVDDDPAFLAIAAVTVGVQRALATLGADPREPSPT